MGADVLGGLAWPQGKGLLIVVFWRRPVGKRWGQVGCLEGTKEACETTKARRLGGERDTGAPTRQDAASEREAIASNRLAEGQSGKPWEFTWSYISDRNDLSIRAPL